jgi:hypothetical protein
MASRRDAQLPALLAFQRLGSVAIRGGEPLGRELWIAGENLLPSGAARCQLEQELDAEPRATNTGLSAENP